MADKQKSAQKKVRPDICIVLIMFNGAQRLKKRQMARYGEDMEYNTYANRTPIIIPLLPIYHLNKKK